MHTLVYQNNQEKRDNLNNTGGDGKKLYLNNSKKIHYKCIQLNSNGSNSVLGDRIGYVM
jgi:hypothetical protein